LTSVGALGQLANSIAPLRRLTQWLDAMPHPAVVCEISATHVAAAKWNGRARSLDGFAVEHLPPGALTPSPVDVNVVNAEAVQGALSKVLAQLPGRGQDLALLIPDPVVRVFILPFDSFPRRMDEGIPMLRFRLKKSVPFDVEETVVSFMRQTGREGKLEVVASLARQRIVREYEAVVKAAGMNAGVVLSSTLAALPLLDEEGPALLVRMSGKNLTTVIVNGNNLCVYRSTGMAVEADLLDPQAMLDELFPAVAYYQDTWGDSIKSVRLAGFGSRAEMLQEVLQKEMGCEALPLSAGRGALATDGRKLMEQQLEALVGWAVDQGA
jgi:type IV pilus assembly protein PilM